MDSKGSLVSSSNNTTHMFWWWAISIDINTKIKQHGGLDRENCVMMMMNIMYVLDVGISVILSFFNYKPPYKMDLAASTEAFK